MIAATLASVGPGDVAVMLGTAFTTGGAACLWFARRWSK